jgi:uncharacterized YccA/Bax inhibitor family protein
MQSSNPVFNRAIKSQPGYAQMKGASQVIAEPATVEALYSAPAASSIRTGRMTIDDVVTRTGILFAVLVASGAAAWYYNLSNSFLFLGMFGGFGLAMVITFSKTIRPPLVIAYAGLEGLALGVISHFYESVHPGIVSQAIIGTLAAFVGVLLMYKSGRIRVTPKFTRVLMGAIVGYLILGLASMIAAATGVGHGYGFYGVSGLGLLLAMGGVALASFFLILDFDQVEKMIKAGAPHQEAWRAGFGLMVTVVWLYLEILRLLSILRRD